VVPEFTVMRTTFLGLQEPFEAWIDHQWQSVKPYSDRETVQFPEPYGKAGVYWFDMPEAFTLVDSFL
jgi:saccharopine dehydrogenase-like NADP-dependent oxidoreductase